MSAGVEASWIRLGDGADCWHPVMKRTHFYNYHRPPPSLSQLSYCLHTHQQHILRTLGLVAYYLNTSLLKSLTILVQIFVENRLDIKAWPRSCYRNAINFVVTRCCECLVAVDSGHLGRGSVTNFLSIYGVKCCSRGRRAAGLQIETIRYGDKKYLSHN